MLRAYRVIAEAHGCADRSSMAAVATEVFRKAPNGAAYLARVQADVGIDVRLVSQVSTREKAQLIGRGRCRRKLQASSKSRR